MDAIAVLNSGSSSLKFSLFAVVGEGLQPSVSGHVDAIHTTPHFRATRGDGTIAAEQNWSEKTSLGHEGALDVVVEFLRKTVAADRLVGVGHRVVHGGLEFKGPVLIDSLVMTALEKLVPLAPLHQPHSLASIKRLLVQTPEIPQVACFDTAFHRTNPELAERFGLPESFHVAGVRRYGFHGLSYEYIASALHDVDPKAAAGKTVVLHLGNGASMCAMDASCSVASTMGFTAVDGLLMGTRSGSLDPGVILYLMDSCGFDSRRLEALLYEQSGLLGVSGISSDMRTLLSSQDPRAKLAVDLFCYRIQRELGSLAAALGGLDAIVFTGGIGEHAAPVREHVCRDAAWLGIEIDAAANAQGGPCISLPAARVAAWVIPTNEELMIARHTWRMLH